MAGKSESEGVKYRINAATGLALVGFALLSDMLDWLLAWIPLVNIIWALIAHFSLAVMFFAVGVNPFVPRPLPLDSRKRHKKKKKRKKGWLGALWGLAPEGLRNWMKKNGRMARFFGSFLLEASPLSLLALIPWRTVNTYLLIEESREEDEEEAETKQEEKEAAEEERAEFLEQQSVLRSRTEEYLGQADELDPAALAEIEALQGRDPSLRDEEGGPEAFAGKRFEELERGRILASGALPGYAPGAAEGFGAGKRPSELVRDLEPQTDVSDANRRAVEALNAIDAARRPSAVRDVTGQRGLAAGGVGEQLRHMRPGFGEVNAKQQDGRFLDAVRKAREDQLLETISPEDARRISAARRGASGDSLPASGPSTAAPTRTTSALGEARQALRSQKLSRDDYTRIIEASSRIPPAAKSAFLGDLQTNDWSGAKSLEEYRGIINANPNTDAGAKSALFQEMNTTLEAARLAHSYQDAMALKNDVRAAVRDIIERREKSGRERIPIGVNTAADVIFKKIRTEPKNWEPVEDELVDELLRETIARMKDRGLGGEVKVTLRDARQ